MKVHKGKWVIILLSFLLVPFSNRPDVFTKIWDSSTLMFQNQFCVQSQNPVPVKGPSVVLFFRKAIEESRRNVVAYQASANGYTFIYENTCKAICKTGAPVRLSNNAPPPNPYFYCSSSLRSPPFC